MGGSDQYITTGTELIMPQGFGGGFVDHTSVVNGKV